MCSETVALVLLGEPFPVSGFPPPTFRAITVSFFNNNRADLNIKDGHRW